MLSLLPPGDNVAGHEILHHLDTYARVEVYAALRPNGEPCALEFAATETWGIESLCTCLANQGKAIARIAHPGVVRPDGLGVWDDGVWRSSALIEGETLRQRLRMCRPPLDVALWWMLQACDAVAAAHEQGVIHGSLTPDTLIVPDDHAVKVVGFGLSALSGHGVEYTEEQQLLMALHAPAEQRWSDAANPKWDIYPMGLMLYEALTGIHPMGDEARPLGDVIIWHIGGEPQPLLSLAPDVPPALAALVQRAMEKDADERLDSMRALAGGVRAALDSLRAAAPAKRPMAGGLRDPRRGTGGA